MPPIAIAAGIGAAGAIGSAAISSGASKKASKAQASASQQQIQAATANRDYQYNLNAPTINAGNAATNTIQGLLNVGGDPAASRSALDTFRASSGYQDLLKTGLDAVNANAYARGMGNSGAALKALQAKGASIANSSMQGYLTNLTNLASSGAQARNTVAGVGSNTVNLTGQATQGAADAASNNALITGSNISSALGNLANLGASAFGSSYASPAATNAGIYGNSPTLQGQLPLYTGKVW